MVFQLMKIIAIEIIRTGEAVDREGFRDFKQSCVNLIHDLTRTWIRVYIKVYATAYILNKQNLWNFPPKKCVYNGDALLFECVAGTAQYIPLNYGKSVYLARSGINTELEYLQTQIEARSIIRSNEPVNLLFGFNYRRHYGPRRVCWTY